MLVELDQLQNLPVASMGDSAQIGHIEETLINPETGELVGFWVKTGGWFSPKRALSSRDVISYDPKAVVVSTADALVDATEIRPFQRVAQSKDKWIGKTVETENGEAIGKVRNLIVNTDLEMLAKIIVTSTFGSERVISRDDIVNVTKQAITVKNRTTVTPTVTANEIATA